MKSPFEIIDVSGDIGLRVSGKRVEDIFINAVKGLYSLITDINGIEEKDSIEIYVKDDSPEGLLVRFLNELIFHFDARGFTGKDVEIIRSNLENIQENEFFINAKIKGEEFDPLRHERRLLIKAATYHNLKLYRNDSGWVGEIIFDI